MVNGFFPKKCNSIQLWTCVLGKTAYFMWKKAFKPRRRNMRKDDCRPSDLEEPDRWWMMDATGKVDRSEEVGLEVDG